MPSFFSKKTRSQAAEGPAGESLGSAPPPGPYQQQQQQFYQQQQQQYASQTGLNQSRRPSLPFITGNNFQNHPAHNSHPAGADLRYGRDVLLDQQQPPPPQTPQQQQQQQQKHRHPAHHDPHQSSISRPTINLVTGQQQIQNEPPSYQPSPTTGTNSAERLWTATQANSTSSPEPNEKTHKLHKKKGLFSRNQSATTSRIENSVGRSASVRHTFGLQHHHQTEHGRVGSLQANTNQLAADQSSLDSETQRPPTGEQQQQPPASDQSLPQTPLDSQSSQRQELEPSDRGHPLWQQSRPDSVDSTPSQVSLQLQRQYTSSYQEDAQPPPSPLHFPPPLFSSQLSSLSEQSSSRPSLGPASLTSASITHNSDLVISQTSSRRPSVQQTNVNHPASSANDMASGDRQQQQGGSQGQMPARRNSLAAAGQGQTQSHPQTAPSGPLYKGNGSSQQNLHDLPAQGRETPPAGLPPSKLREELESLDVAALVLRHEELQGKYQKVKRYYFEKEAQVTQLQNTVAHQRMATSRTVLDDNEYTARFNRLDGAIKELSFSIRKEWKSVPEWLHPYVNEDAVAVGTKEMTAVGRAVISRWVVKELFNRYFHPGLERSFSERLKTVELNLRHQQVQVFNDDDKENQVARISNWRRTTLDGLADELQSKTTADNQAQLTEHLIEKLSTTLHQNLNESATPELARYTQTIVENAVNIAEKIPQESRDIVVDYVPPGTVISETVMKTETGLPPLSRPMAAEDYSASSERGDNTDDMDIDVSSKETASNSSPIQQQQQQQTENSNNSRNPASLPQSREQRKKYPFGSLMGKKSSISSSNSNPPAQSSASSSPSDPQARSVSGSASLPENNSQKESEEQQQHSEKRPRVRLATFMTVEVRGRGPNNVLVQAPVYTIES